MASRVASVAIAATALLAAACGEPERRPERIVDPMQVGVIRTVDRHEDGVTIALESEDAVELVDGRHVTLEATGNTQPGDLLVVGDSPTGLAIGVLAPLPGADPAVDPAWTATAPAWVTETHIVFDSGLRLPKAGRFEVAPGIRPPADSGYAMTGTFVVDQQGTVHAMR